MLIDGPKSLASSDERTRRLSLLFEPHIAPLTELAEKIRLEPAAGAGVPYFDPLDGGTLAECLFLLEAPGGRAVGSGFVSRNNPDETAKNFFLLNTEAGLARVRTVTWNVIPWYVGSGTKIRAVNADDMRAAEPYLLRLSELLPQVRAVVLLGKKSQRARAVLSRHRPDWKIFHCPHPSPLVLNGRPHRRSEILDCLGSVARYLDGLLNQ